MPLVGAPRKPRQRRGAAVLLVILLLAVTLGLSYAMVRLQGMSMQVQRNSSRRELARQAAATGIDLAIKQMQMNAWSGVSTTLSGALNSTDSYSVTYTTGDATLTTANSAYSEYPFRVTLEATGQSADPADATRVSTHNTRVVMRLVPRQLVTEPTNWSNAVTNTVYQTSSGGTFAVEFPSRTVGQILCSSPLQLGTENGWSNTVRKQYFSDLGSMRSNGYGDCRPFTGPVYLPSAGQNAATMSWLTSMGTAPNYTSAGAMSLTPALSSTLTYQLYTGGKSYTAPALGATVQSVSYEADPINNPLGFFTHQGEVDLYNNTTIQGSLLAMGTGTGEIYIYGTNVQLQPVNLPALYVSGQSPSQWLPIQLPVAQADDSLRIQPGCGGTVTGVATAGGSFEIETDSQYDINLQMNTRVFAENYLIHYRTGWNFNGSGSTLWTNPYYNNFKSQKGAHGGIPYFPVYMKSVVSFDYAPRLVIQPDSHTVQYHWKKRNDPIYIANPSDEGLRWEVVSWSDDL